MYEVAENHLAQRTCGCSGTVAEGLPLLRADIGLLYQSSSPTLRRGHSNAGIADP